jgi:hypothetical protein
MYAPSRPMNLSLCWLAPSTCQLAINALRMALLERLLHRDTKYLNNNEKYQEFEFLDVNQYPQTPQRKYVTITNLFSIYNLSIVAILILLFLIGAGIGIGVFFEQRIQDERNGSAGLEELATGQTIILSNTVNNTLRSVFSLNAIYAFNNGSVDYYTQFLPFINISRVIVNGTAAFQFCPLVMNSDRDAFQRRVSKFGPLFANFTIFDRKSNGSTYISPTAPHTIPYYILHRLQHYHY